MVTEHRSSDQAEAARLGGHRLSSGFLPFGGFASVATAFAVLTYASGPSVAQEPYDQLISEAVKGGVLEEEDVAMMVVVRLSEDNVLSFETYVSEKGEGKLFQDEKAYEDYLEQNNWEITDRVDGGVYNLHPGSDCVSKVLGTVIDWCKLQGG
jgi:hypothetical protein